MRAGLATEIITPKRGVNLSGYFNYRNNRGVLDDLQLKVLLIEQNGVTGGIISYDTCFLDHNLVEAMIAELKSLGFTWADNIIFAATHTHTGAQMSEFLGMPGDAECCKDLIVRTANGVKRAYANLSEASFEFVQGNENPYAYIRRYWMKDGSVVTNPGKLNPNIVKPEGQFDPAVKVLALKQENRIAALLVNLTNHGDTIGGDLVSADWPGFMEQEIQYRTGEAIPVFTIMAPSGNVNHFDVTQPGAQAEYAEARKIGRGYGTIVCNLLAKLQPIEAKEFSVLHEYIDIPFRTIPPADVAQAEKFLADTADQAGEGDLTSEGIASGNCAVARFFAQNLVDYHHRCEGHSRKMRQVALRFAPELAIVSLPGEPFNEIGQQICAASPYKNTFVVELAMGECGYVPLVECFGRGGYETMPVVGGSPREDTAPRLIANATSLLTR